MWLKKKKKSWQLLSCFNECSVAFHHIWEFNQIFCHFMHQSAITKRPSFFFFSFVYFFLILNVLFFVSPRPPNPLIRDIFSPENECLVCCWSHQLWITDNLTASLTFNAMQTMTHWFFVLMSYSSSSAHCSVTLQQYEDTFNCEVGMLHATSWCNLPSALVIKFIIHKLS